MARKNSLEVKASTKRIVVDFLNSTATIWAICTKHTSRVAKKLCPDTSNFLAKIKTTRFRNKKRVNAANKDFHDNMSDGEYGLWQRSILMGDKCEPLDFSGVICYDSSGKKLDELPVKSPRASPLPLGYHFSSAARRENEF